MVGTAAAAAAAEVALVVAVAVVVGCQTAACPTVPAGPPNFSVGSALLTCTQHDRRMVCPGQQEAHFLQACRADSPLQLSHLLRIASHTQIRYPWLSLNLPLILTLTLHRVAWHAHTAVSAHVLWPTIRIRVPALRSHDLRTLLIRVLLLRVLSLITLRHLLLLLLRDDAVVLVQKLSVILL